MDLLATTVWISGQGMIPWADVTLDDVAETISSYEVQISGVHQRITKLEAARKLMADHGVGRFGDIPDEEDQRRVIAMPG